MDRSARSNAETRTDTNVKDLVRSAQSGSSAAYGELVARFESPLFNFVLRRTASAEDAEEVTQDAFVRAWQKIDGYDPRWSFATWLFTIARHLAATRRRDAASKSGVPTANNGATDTAIDELPMRDEGRDESRDGPYDEAGRANERGSVWSIADRVLGPDQRSALWLRYAEDLSVGEIATVLGRSSVSVRVLLHRARATLGRALAPDVRGSIAAPSSRSAAELRKVGT
jgi:RNA polymerase sigma-70 factor (ECF subfamily)